MLQSVSIKFCIAPICCLLSVFSFAQRGSEKVNDTILLNQYAKQLRAFIETNRDSGLYYGYKALAIAKKLDQKYYQGFILADLAYTFLSSGDYSNSLKCLVEASKLAEEKDIGINILSTPYIESNLQGNGERNRRQLQAWIKNSLGILYGLTGNPDKKLEELLEAKRLIENETTDMFLLSGITSNITEVYILQNKFDSALYYQRKTMEYESKDSSSVYTGASLVTIGDIFRLQGELDSSKKYIFEGIKLMNEEENVINPAHAYLTLAGIYYKTNQFDSGIYYARKALVNYSLAGTAVPELLDAYTALSVNYGKKNRPDSAYQYMALAKNFSDSLNNIKINNLAKFHSIGYEDKLRLKELETETLATKSRNRVILLLVIIIVFFIIVFILYRNNKIKHKSNRILGTTLAHLKATQSQLIQSEKMASLGELTAGIAHEIQNPLNFVNNFSEVNKELVDELQQELKTGNIEDAIIISNDIKANEEKINHHGRRADAIVKGMLQHSRSGSGTRELTDSNALADEYLRLAYHGLRAKDKTFNATMKTDFDVAVGSISIIPQDIGRVILNLITNAFYTVAEKKKQALTSSAGDRYEPTVAVSTKKINDKVEIKVKDNGNGIPPQVLDKIFQPFFTTKPTGQGTGLGLSLSYDIVKAHGGALKVETKEGEGTEFIIVLPAI